MIENSLPSVITIDGPGGSGKGTISQHLAWKFGWEFLDSGALYRLVGLSATHKSIELGDVEKIAALARSLDAQFAVREGKCGTESIIFLEDVDVTDTLRTEECASAASRVAQFLPVREALLERQRAFRVEPGLIADGRDMGTVIFPDAELKVFLTADAEIRAERRLKQLKGKGIDANLAAILADIKARDKRDTNRSISPLIPADDATIIDTSDLSVQEVEEQVLRLAMSTFNLIEVENS